MTLGDLLNSAVLRAGAKRGDFVGKNRAQTGLPAHRQSVSQSARRAPQTKPMVTPPLHTLVRSHQSQNLL